MARGLPFTTARCAGRRGCRRVRAAKRARKPHSAFEQRKRQKTAPHDKTGRGEALSAWRNVPNSRGERVITQRNRPNGKRKRSSERGNFALQQGKKPDQNYPMAQPYIPNRDTQLKNWADNFATLTTANYAAYGLSNSDASIINTAAAAYGSALSVILSPDTRTPSTVAAKDSTKAVLLSIVRPYAQRINGNAGVTDEMRAALGLTIRKTVPTPVPPPSTSPSLNFRSAIHNAATLGYTDPVQPSGKAKPYGVTRVELFVAFGTLPAIDPAQATYFGSITKSPCTIDVPQAWVGKTITVYGRYSTRSGPGGVAQVGPFSAPLVFTGL